MRKLLSQGEKAGGRRKALAGIGILGLVLIRVRGLLPLKKRIIACAPPVEKKKIRVLSQDGRLMEVDAGSVRTTGKKITNTELREWVRRK